jgi:hypothetical protein
MDFYSKLMESRSIVSKKEIKNMPQAEGAVESPCFACKGPGFSTQHPKNKNKQCLILVGKARYPAIPVLSTFYRGTLKRIQKETGTRWVQQHCLRQQMAGNKDV